MMALNLLKCPLQQLRIAVLFLLSGSLVFANSGYEDLAEYLLTKLSADLKSSVFAVLPFEAQGQAFWLSF